jgi:outer membrane autotransporter protein
VRPANEVDVCFVKMVAERDSRSIAAVVEAGVETQLRPNLTLGASYAGQFGDGLEDHGFKASLNRAF